MQTFFADFQNNLPLIFPVILITIIIIVSCIIFCLLLVAKGRSKLDSLRASLGAENTANEQKNKQLAEELDNAQQNRQQLELQIKDKEGDFEHMQTTLQQMVNKGNEQVLTFETHIKQRNQQLNELLDNLAQNLQLEQPSLTESDMYTEVLWQRHHVLISELTTRLMSDAQVQAELQQSSEIAITNLANKESEIQELEQLLNKQIEQVSQLEQDFVAQKSTIEALQEKEQDLLKESLSRVNDLEQTQADAVDKMNLAQQTAQQLQQELDDKNIRLEVLEAIQVKVSLLEEALNERMREIEQISMEKNKANQNAEEIQVLETRIEQYSSEFIHNLKTLAQNFNLTFKVDQSLSLWQQHDKLMSQLSSVLKKKSGTPVVKSLPQIENSVQLEELQQTINGQKNHIARLEYDLELKKLILQDRNYDLQSIPAIILEKQAADQAHISELEKALAGTGKNPMKRVIAKVQHLPQDIKQQLNQCRLNPVKGQLSTEKIAHQTTDTLNEQSLISTKEKLKGFFSHKLSPFMKS